MPCSIEHLINGLFYVLSQITGEVMNEMLSEQFLIKAVKQ